MIYYYVIYNGDWIAITKDLDRFYLWLIDYKLSGVIKIKDTTDFKFDSFPQVCYYNKINKVKHLF